LNEKEHERLLPHRTFDRCGDHPNHRGDRHPELAPFSDRCKPSSAVGSLRTLNTAEITYSSTFNTGFSANLAYLGPPTGGAGPVATAAGLVDSVLSGLTQTTANVYTSAKSGYAFAYTPGAADTTGRINTYTFEANPITSSTGTNYYFTDQSGVIRQNSTTTAQGSDSPIAG